MIDSVNIMSNKFKDTTYAIFEKLNFLKFYDSPIIVDLKCPTCISLAIFGEEKSTPIVYFYSYLTLSPFCKIELILFI